MILFVQRKNIQETKRWFAKFEFSLNWYVVQVSHGKDKENEGPKQTKHKKVEKNKKYQK